MGHKKRKDKKVHKDRTNSEEKIIECETRTFDELKSQVNELFKQNHDAIELHKKKLDVNPDAAVIHLNLSLAWLSLNHFKSAYEHAQMALDSGADREKALYRLADLDI